MARKQATPATPADMNAPSNRVGNCHFLPWGSIVPSKKTAASPASTATGISITIYSKR
jgi:hypothetical protein